MFGMFGKKKQVTEETVTWSPPGDKEDPMDDMGLCTKCDFKGRCQFKTGCKSLQKIEATRKAALDDIRGYKQPDQVVSGDQKYMRSLSWKEHVDGNRTAFIKMSHVEYDHAFIDVTIRYDRDRSQDAVQFTLDVAFPFVQNEFGRDIVNIQQFRSEVRKALNKKL